MVGKNHVDFAVDPPLDDIDYQYNKRDDTINRQANSSQTYLTDLYLPRSGEANNNSHPGQHVLSHKEFPPCGEEFFGTETGLAESDNAFQKSIVPIHSNNKMMNSEGNYHHLTPNTLQASECLRECERVCTNEATTVWEESEESSRHEEDNSKVEKYNFSVVSTNETGGSLGLEIAECSNDCSSEACLSVEKSSSQLNENQHYAHQSFPKCRYSFGHNKYPEVPSKQNEAPAILPSFWSAFCTYGAYNKAYSLCRNSYTGTTEAHLNPIMTTAYASPYSPHASSQLPTVSTDFSKGIRLTPIISLTLFND